MIALYFLEFKLILGSVTKYKLVAYKVKKLKIEHRSN